MEKETIKQQWMKLSAVRAWIANRLGDGADATDNALFEAQQAIGYALLSLEKADYLAHRPAANSAMIDNQQQRRWPE